VVLGRTGCAHVNKDEVKKKCLYHLLLPSDVANEPALLLLDGHIS
jgi:hypothetical protein